MSAGLLAVGRADAVRLPLANECVDAVVTDPPYSLEFMGKAWSDWAPGSLKLRSGWTHAAGGGSVGKQGKAPRQVTYAARRTTWKCSACGRRDAFRNAHSCAAPWDRIWVDDLPNESIAFQNWTTAWARELLRVTRPGGLLASFGGSRHWHRLAAGIEDAGWEIINTAMWILTGDGMPVAGRLRTNHQPIVIARKLTTTGPKGSVQPTHERWPQDVVAGPDAARALGLGPMQYSTTRVVGSSKTRTAHPTQKPLDLMQWLVGTVTARGGVVLDPFCGSGTTQAAAVAQGCRAVGFDLSAKWSRLAARRTGAVDVCHTAGDAQPRLI